MTREVNDKRDQGFYVQWELGKDGFTTQERLNYR